MPVSAENATASTIQQKQDRKCIFPASRGANSNAKSGAI